MTPEELYAAESRAAQAGCAGGCIVVIVTVFGILLSLAVVALWRGL